MLPKTSIIFFLGLLVSTFFISEPAVANTAPTTNGTIPDQTVGVGAPATTLDVSSYFTDPDSDTLSYTATSSDTAIATVGVSNATISITAVALGTATITVTATDTSGLTATQTFSVTVSQPNRAPVTVGTMPDQTATVGGSPTTINMSSYFSDPDGDTLTYTESVDTEIAPNAIHLTTSLEDIVSISATKPGKIQLTVTATDPGGLTATQSCTITMFIGDNRPPVILRTISDQTLKVDEEFTIDTVDTYFNDPNDDTLGHTFFSSNTHIVGLAGRPTGGVTFLALAAGTATIEIKAEDPGGLTATLSFTITVEGVETPNKTPVAVGTISDKTLNVGGDALIIDVSSNFNDPDGDTLSYAFDFSDPSKINASVTGATALFTGVAAGTVTVTVTATDTGNLSATQTFTLTVIQPNRAPTTNGTISDQTLTVGDSATTLDVSSYFTDPDSDTLSYTATSADTAIATVGVSNATVSITAVALGTATITVTATDTSGLTATQTFSVTVSQPNRAPVAVGTIPDQTLITEGAAVTVDVSSYFSDPDGDPLSYAFDSSDTNKLNASITGSTILFTSVAAGTVVTVTVTATDTNGLTATQTFTVEAIEEDIQPNNAPVAVGTIPDQTATVGGIPITINMSNYFSDPDGDTLTYTTSFDGTDIESNALIIKNWAGTIITVSATKLGKIQLTVTATDRGGLTATQSCTITVNPQPNRAPVKSKKDNIPDQHISSSAGWLSVIVEIKGYFSDPDGDALTYTAISADTSVATVSVSNADATVNVWRAALTASGTSIITVTATDPSGLTATQTFTVTVEAAAWSNQAQQANVTPVFSEDLATFVDLNGDGAINILDLVFVAGQIGEPAKDNPTDVNKDGVINILDLVLVASAL